MSYFPSLPFGFGKKSQPLMAPTNMDQNSIFQGQGPTADEYEKRQYENATKQAFNSTISNLNNMRNNGVLMNPKIQEQMNHATSRAPPLIPVITNGLFKNQPMAARRGFSLGNTGAVQADVHADYGYNRGSSSRSLGRSLGRSLSKQRQNRFTARMKSRLASRIARSRGATRGTSYYGGQQQQRSKQMLHNLSQRLSNAFGLRRQQMGGYKRSENKRSENKRKGRGAGTRRKSTR